MLGPEEIRTDAPETDAPEEDGIIQRWEPLFVSFAQSYQAGDWKPKTRGRKKKERRTPMVSGKGGQITHGVN